MPGGKKGNHLLNFHFRQTLQTPQESTSHRRRPKHASSNHRGPRRTPNSRQFYLHSSADHAFIIRRTNKDGSSALEWPGGPVSWENVKVVRHLLPFDTEHHCPICLDQLTCPRITKCGHSFCLTCLVRYVNAVTDEAKCPLCWQALALCDIRCVEFATVTPPVVGQTIWLQKLHRVGSCPAPFVPTPDAPKRASPRAAPCPSDPDAPYSRFRYLEPEMYQSLLYHNLHELETFCPSDAQENSAVDVARQLVHQQLQTAYEEAIIESEVMERYANSSAGIYLSHPPALVYQGPTLQRDDLTESMPRNRGDSMLSQDESVDNRAQGSKQSGSRTVPSSMFLADDEVAFYQSQDGQLVFLSPFNMKCLLHDFASKVSLVNDDATPHKSLPLPDLVHGKILEIESLHLMEEARSRHKSLSHLPLYTDILFVEINLGPLLSATTKKVFRKEFLKRKSARESQLAAERKQDSKAQRREEYRINALKQRYQRVDPNDEFFSPAPPTDSGVPAGDDFGPALSTSPSGRGTTIPRISVLAAPRMNGAFSALGSDESSFPALGSSPESARHSTGLAWGGRAPNSPTDASKTSPATATKKSSKGKKVLLFSTGGKRGNW